MSIASEITRLQGVKADILSAIAGKGVTVPAGSALGDCPDLIASIAGGSVDLSDFEIKSKMELDSSYYNSWQKDNYAIDLGTTFSNKDYFICEMVLRYYGVQNVFYSGVSSYNKEIDFCAYKAASGDENFSPKCYFNNRGVEINGNNIGVDVICSQSLTTNYQQRGNGWSIQSINIPEYDENTFDKIVLWGTSYSGGNLSVQRCMFCKLTITSRDYKNRVILVPAIKISTNESGVLDMISGRFNALNHVNLFDV